MRAWNLESLTPAIISVDLKYLSALSPPRLRRLYTRYLEIVRMGYEIWNDETYFVTSPKARPSFLK